jgi:hypothetical protein
LDSGGQRSGEARLDHGLPIACETGKAKLRPKRARCHAQSHVDGARRR